MEAVAFLVVLLVLAALLTPLALAIAIYRRQEWNRQEFTGRLNDIERAMHRTQELLRQQAEALRTVSPPPPQPVPVQAAAPSAPAPTPPEPTRAEKPVEAPVRPAVVAEQVIPVAPVSVEAPQPIPTRQGLPTRRVEPAPTAWRAAASATPPKPPAEPTPRTPTQFETAAKEILRKIWRWILVGEDELPEGVSIEYAVAKNWFLRFGVVVLVMSIGFFLQYSIKNGWIDEQSRVLLSAAAGLGMLVGGTRLLGRKYHLFGQGMIGGGIAVLYFSVFAARTLYDLIGIPAAFGLMIAVTCLAGGIAVWFDSLLVAILGIIGGYATPILLHTGVVNFVGLYTYVLVLGVGVFGISIRKNWHLLNYLSFIGTYVLFFGAMQKYKVSDFWSVIPFLILFFALYSTMTFLFNLVNRKKSTLLEVLILFVNAGVFFGVSYDLVRDAYSKEWVAAISLGLALFYAAHVYYFLVRRLLDRELLMSFLGLASFFLTVTIPLILSREWITPCWAVQALVMLWIAGKLESQFLRHVAYVLYAIVLGRFAFLDLRRQYLGAAAMDVPLADYLWHMVERLMVFGVPIASLAGAGWLVRWAPAPVLPVGRENDIGDWVKQRGALVGIAAVAIGMLFVALHFELYRSFGYFYAPLRLPMLSLLWVALCVFLLFEYCARPSHALLSFFLFVVVVLVAKLFVFDLMSWHVDYEGLAGVFYGGSYSHRDGAMRLLDFGAIILFLSCAYYVIRGVAPGETTKAATALLGSAAVAMLFVFLSLEVNTFLRHYRPEFRAGGISILWSLFALGLILAGMWKDARAARYVGLLLFAIVTWKVFFSDLARLDRLYRIVAFFFVGVLLLCGSLIYMKYAPTFALPKKATPKTGTPEDENEEKVE